MPLSNLLRGERIGVGGNSSATSEARIKLHLLRGERIGVGGNFSVQDSAHSCAAPLLRGERIGVGGNAGFSPHKKNMITC